MPLNYSKWDQLELSDDSDIEGHPNVDKKSLIRWKQRDIHEKREARKDKIASLRAQIDCNTVLLPRIREIRTNLTTPASIPPTTYFNNLVEQLEKNPSKDCPPGNDPSKLEHTYDGMILNLLQLVSQQAKEKIKDASVLDNEKDEKLAQGLIDGMEFHCEELKKTIDRDQAELEAEEKEQKKHITSDDLHEGFSSKYVPAKLAPPAVPVSKIEKPKSKQTVTEYEVLNPTPGPDSVLPESSVLTEDDDSLPELTPSLQAFAKLPLWAYEKSFEFIQAHRDVVVPGAADALLVAAFNAQTDGKGRYAKQCIHQSLLLQYCEKLGPDGVQVFFRKMISGDKRAEKVFVDDVENTYGHLVNRVQKSKEEIMGGKEQIQLVPESADQQITFNVPSGPPPENIILEGPGTENMDIEEVRKALQYRWEVFQGFPQALQTALTENSLQKVNEVLANMDVTEAESIVGRLDMAGILSFAEGGIRDETGRAEKKEK
ncbi:hsp90 co-chaperone cdc37 [Moniliophthora roreri MCA 2997]|uniref:Hsp90 chaperone protein kinase-targeting subunit n=2 Tax=Moniliophthora roreri TaxID=221103 RepID=V2X9L5_MONRO|nr:hsp90 co-chaperone cdc37 [Moniliophthora roreri MCA 2997]KAI3616222.1 hsp90 co-chaperone cdc37 [Moniliophthora roreri]